MYPGTQSENAATRQKANSEKTEKGQTLTEKTAASQKSGSRQTTVNSLCVGKDGLPNLLTNCQTLHAVMTVNYEDVSDDGPLEIFLAWDAEHDLQVDNLLDLVESGLGFFEKVRVERRKVALVVETVSQTRDSLPKSSWKIVVVQSG